MTLFSKFTKNTASEKSIYPWSQRKLSGSNNALPRFGHGATMIDNQHFLVFGGIFLKGNMKKNLFLVDTNNISASSLSTSGDIPSSRSFTTLISIGGFVLLYGGEPMVPGDMWDPYFYVLHMNTKQWSRVRTKGRLPSERSGHSTCVSDGIMYIWGGHFQRKYLNDLCAFNVKEYPSKAEWEFISYENEGPAPRSGHVSVIYDNKLYIFGGVNASHLFNDIWYFDLSTKTWHQIAAVGYIPAPRESCAAALVEDTIYIFGGKGLNQTGLGDLCAYRIKSQRWYMFQNMGAPPSPRFGSTLTVIQNKIYVFGGDSITGKTEDSSFVYILDCSKIKYPPEPESTESERLHAERMMMNNRKLPQKPRSTQEAVVKEEEEEELVDPTLKLPLPPQSPRAIHNNNKRQLPTSPTLRQFHHHHHHDDKNEAEQQQQAIESNIKHDIVPPKRPPREGATLGEIYRSPTIDPSALKFKRESLNTSKPPIDSDEKISLMRDIMAKDSIITEMRKKEQWWRTEVSIAKHERSDTLQDIDTKEANLIDMNDEKLQIFQQLVDVKSEIKKIKLDMIKQSHPISQKLNEADTIRTVALGEAAYYRSKYIALKNRDHDMLNQVETNRVQVLEERLNLAYQEKLKTEANIHQFKQQSQHDKAARLLAEERAKDAQIQSEEAQVAHQEALEKLSNLYEQILKAEAKTREDALVIANLSNDIAEQLSFKENKDDLSQSHIEIGRLEAINIKSRNQIAILSKKLEESKDDEMNLRILLNEKEEAYSEAVLELEKMCIELELLKNASSSSVHNTTTTASIVDPQQTIV